MHGCVNSQHGHVPSEFKTSFEDSYGDTEKVGGQKKMAEITVRILLSHYFLHVTHDACWSANMTFFGRFLSRGTI